MKVQIDANIVWTARVEWIQNVRNLTAELITAVNSYILSGNEETQKKNLDIVREKSELLILYFGPDKKYNVDVDILNRITNESKNEKIVKLIKEIYGGASVYFMKKRLINEYHNSILECEKCKDSSEMYESCKIVNARNVSYDEMDMRCKGYKENNLQMKQKYIRENNELINKLTQLTEVMRVYLKVEWNRAKERTCI